jgi:hypothetical protein
MILTELQNTSVVVSVSDVINTLRTGDADLRLYITTEQDG